MHNLPAFLKRLLRDSAAATAVEYGLILVLVVLAMMASLQQFASSATGMWNNVSDAVYAATH